MFIVFINVRDPRHSRVDKEKSIDSNLLCHPCCIAQEICRLKEDRYMIDLLWSKVDDSNNFSFLKMKNKWHNFLKGRNFKNTFLSISFFFNKEFTFKFSNVLALDDNDQSMLVSVSSSMLLFDLSSSSELNFSWFKPILHLSLFVKIGLLLRQSQLLFLFEFDWSLLI